MPTISNSSVPEEFACSDLQRSDVHAAPLIHSIWQTSIRFTLFTAIILGLVYPLVVTGIAQFAFPHQANGSLIARDGKIIGSELIAQRFASDKYFHPRPSSAGNGYDATASGSSNLAQSNVKLAQRIQADVDRISTANFGQPIPIDMVTTSASGLDPDITPDNAFIQAEHVAKARGISPEVIRALVAAHITPRSLGFLGEPRVNVLTLNLALNDMDARGDRK